MTEPFERAAILGADGAATVEIEIGGAPSRAGPLPRPRCASTYGPTLIAGLFGTKR